MDEHFDRVFGEATQEHAGAKRKRDETPSDGSSAPAVQRASDELTEDEIAALVEAAETADVPSLDTIGVKRLLLGVEKAITKNSLARTKYASEPARFMDTEVELDQQLKKLRVLAAAPDLYGVLISSSTLRSLLNLLAHENSDIAVDVVSLLAELTDDDAIVDHRDSAVELVAAIAESNGIELLVQNINRLETGSGDGNEDDAQGIYASLSVIENFLEISPEIALVFCDTSKTQVSLLAFLLKRIRSRAAGAEANRMYASEVLCILLQCDPVITSRLGSGMFQTGGGGSAVRSVDGIEILLEVLNAYKRRGPTSRTEEELVGNVFDALDTCLLNPENQRRFQAAEGFELMIRMVHETGFVRFPALKVLAYAVQNNVRNAEAFVSAGGLKVMLPAFMGKGLAHTTKVHDAESAQSEEEQSVSIVASLFHLLPKLTTASSAPSDVAAANAPGSGFHRARLLGRFRSTDATGSDAVARAVELYVKYQARVEAIEQDDDSDDEDSSAAEIAARDELRYINRMQGGLFTLQRLCLLLGHLVCATDAEGAGASQAFDVRAKLYEQGGSIVGLVQILEELSEHLRRTATSGTDMEGTGGVGPGGEGLAAEEAVVQDHRRVVALLSALRGLLPLPSE